MNRGGLGRRRVGRRASRGLGGFCDGAGDLRPESGSDCGLWWVRGALSRLRDIYAQSEVQQHIEELHQRLLGIAERLDGVLVLGQLSEDLFDLARHLPEVPIFPNPCDGIVDDHKHLLGCRTPYGNVP